MLTGSKLIAPIALLLMTSACSSYAVKPEAHGSGGVSRAAISFDLPRGGADHPAMPELGADTGGHDAPIATPPLSPEPTGDDRPDGDAVGGGVADAGQQGPGGAPGHTEAGTDVDTPEANTGETDAPEPDARETPAPTDPDPQPSAPPDGDKAPSGGAETSDPDRGNSGNGFGNGGGNGTGNEGKGNGPGGNPGQSRGHR